MEEKESQDGKLLLCRDRKMATQRKVSQRFWDFVCCKSRNFFHHLDDDEWLTNLVFLTDISTTHKKP